MKVKAVSKEREDEIRRALRYEPETGHIYWKETKGRRQTKKPAGTLNHDGYRQIRVNGRKLLSHRIAWFLHFNVWPDNENEIDHKNGLRDDNRIENLREATESENGLNMKCHRGGKLPYTSYHKTSRRWECQIWENDKKLYIGYYSTENEAYNAAVYYKNGAMGIHER